MLGDKSIEQLNDALQKINPNRIDIGTIDRPPAYDVKPINYEKLENIANKLKNLPVNITYKNRPKQIQSFNKNEILNLLKMRPLTQEDIENTFDNNSKTILNQLIKDNTISCILVSGIQFYKFLSVSNLTNSRNFDIILHTRP